MRTIFCATALSVTIFIVVPSVFLSVACSSENKSSGSGGTGGNTGNGGAGLGGNGLGGAQSSGGSSSGGSGTNGGTKFGACELVFSENTSDALALDMKLESNCVAHSFDDGMGHTQINFEASDMAGGGLRDFNIDFFETAKAGVVVHLEDGYDYNLQKGAAASFLDAAGAVWNADSGDIKIESVQGSTYAVLVMNAHFKVLDGATMGSGTFVVNGRITGTVQ